MSDVENPVQDNEVHQSAPEKIDPSLALFNCMCAARQAKLTADEHGLIGACFDRIAELIPGGYQPPQPQKPKAG